MSHQNNHITDQLPFCVIKTNSNFDITYSNTHFKKEFKNIDSLHILIGDDKEVYLINENYTPFKEEDLNIFRIFNGSKSDEQLIIGLWCKSPKRVKWCSITSQAIYDTRNKIVEIVSTLKDVTELYDINSDKQLNFNLYQEHLENKGIYIVKISYLPVKKIIYISEQLTDLLGYKAEDYLTNPSFLLENIHPDDIETFRALEKVNFKSNNKIHFRFIDQNNITKWCHTYFIPHINNNTGEVIRLDAVISNIREHNISNNSLNLENSFLKNLLNKSTFFEFSSLYDNHYTMISLSKTFGKITGYPQINFINNCKNDYNSLIHIQDRETISSIIGSAVEKNIPWQIEYQIKHYKGHYFWVKELGIAQNDDKGNTIINGIVIDISEQKKLVEDKTQSSKNYETIINSSNLGVWEWNIENDETVFNERWANIIGYTIQELKPTTIQTWIERIHPDDLEISNHRIKKHCSNESDFYEAELRMKHKEGHWIWVLNTGKVISKNSKGKAVIMSGIQQDISLRKAEELDLHRKLELERILVKTSNDFMHSDLNFDSIINKAFKELGQITQASRIYTFLFKENKTLMDNVHEWCNEGVSSEIENLQNLSTAAFPWWMTKLNKGEVIQIPDVSKLQSEAKAEKELLEKQNIKSLIVVGLKIKGELIGFIGFDKIHSIINTIQEKELNLLLSISQVFSIAFENKKSKDQIKKSELKFRNIFHKNSSPQLLIDPANGNILEANQAAIEFYEYSPQKLLNENIILLSKEFSDTEHEQIGQSLKALLNNSYLEYQQFTANNIKKTVELFCGLIEIDNTEILHVILHDISEKVSAKDRNLILRTAIEKSPIGLLIADTNGQIEDMNKTAMEISGYQLDEIIGQNTSIFKSDLQERIFYNDLWTTIQSGKIWSGELKNKRKDGVIYWEKSTIIPLYNDQNELYKFVCIKEDIDNKKKTLEEFKIAKERAEESDKLKSSFLSTINQELRTPINHIIGISDVIGDLSADENIIEFSQIINKSGLNLLEIVEDILYLALADQSEIQSRVKNIKIIDLYISLKKSLMDLHQKSPNELDIKLNFKADKSFMNHQIKSDVNKINMILMNFFKNAIKFTKEGSIEFGINATKNSIELYVKDSGIGIPIDKQNIILDFFQQTDVSHSSVHKGIGIGLTIAQRAAKSIGAIIQLKSKEDEGSTFSLILKQTLIAPVKTRVEHFLKPSISIDLSGKKVLIVDDDEDNLLIHQIHMENTNAKTLTARNGKLAVDKVINEAVDFILMDLQMPIMDGFEASINIKKLYPNIPIIGVTAFPYPKEKKDAIKAGCNEVISKPVNKQYLLNVLKRHLIE